MDPRSGSQGYAAGSQSNGGSNYAFNSTQNDPFHSFINTEDEGAFDNTWRSPDFSTNSQPSWQPNPYPASESNFLPIPQFNMDPQYANADSAFQYSSFNSNPAQDFASRDSVPPPSYNNASEYGNGSLSNDTSFQYPGPSELQPASQTISPQAIESYPSYSQQAFESGRHVSFPVLSLTIRNADRV